MAKMYLSIMSWCIENGLVHKEEPFLLRLDQSYSNNLPRTDQNLLTISYDTVNIEILEKQYVESNNYNRSYSAEVNYTEPIAKDHFLMFGYNYSIKDNDIDKTTFMTWAMVSNPESRIWSLPCPMLPTIFIKVIDPDDYRFQNKKPIFQPVWVINILSWIRTRPSTSGNTNQ